MSNVFFVLVMLVFLASGVAFAVDFRGVATAQGRRAVEASRAVGSVLRRGPLTGEKAAKRAARHTNMQRVTGAVIALLSLFILVVALNGIFTLQ